MTQYPMEGTIADFWRMIFQKSTVAIVNLTQPNEEEPVNHTAYPKAYGAYVCLFSIGRRQDIALMGLILFSLSHFLTCKGTQ